MNTRTGTSCRLVVSAVLLGTGIAGCRSVGPRTISRDGFDYTTAIADAWKKQMLLNLVKIRYADVPMFVEVSSIINQYAFETVLSARATWNEFLPGKGQQLGGAGRYADRPTITYQPLAGEKFTRNLLTPLAPSAILTLIEAGWPVDRLLRVAVQAINGLDNETSAITVYHEAEPEFYQFISALTRVQRAGAFGTRLENRDGAAIVTLFFDSDGEESVRKDIALVKELLSLDPDADAYNVVQGVLPRSSDEIAIQTRSIMEIMRTMAGQIDVPQEDVDDGWVTATLPQIVAEQAGFPRLFRVHCDKRNPPHAYAAVEYRGYSFWIDGREPYSKRMLSFLMILLSLSESGDPTKAPGITLPAG